MVIHMQAHPKNMTDKASAASAVKSRKGLYARRIKRALDFTLALTALAVLSPVLAVAAVLVAFHFGRPILFRQERPGLSETLFTIYKFRTMTNQTDANGRLLPDEQRITRFSQFLRSTSLDELPSLFNILRGDLAIVGPRPLLPKYLPLYNDRQRRRHEVRPGLTGLAQVNGRNAISWEERFALDVQYVDNITFWGDMKIVGLTFLKVVKREGISSGAHATMPAFLGSCETGGDCKD